MLPKDHCNCIFYILVSKMKTNNDEYGGGAGRVPGSGLGEDAAMCVAAALRRGSDKVASRETRAK